jgi:type I restriction enzyme, S subunit
MTPDRVPTRLGVLPSDWKVLPLGQVTERTALPIDVEPGGLYREIGIRSHGKGIFHKEPVNGSTLGAKRVFRIVPNRLVFNIVFAWEGAVAATSRDEEGMIASHRFPMFGPTGEGLIDVEFLRRFFQTELGVKLLGDASPGGAGRNRTLNQKFTSEIPVPVPPLREQRKIAAILSSVDDAIESTQAVIDQLGVVKKAMMAELLTRGLPGRHTRFKQTEIGEVPEEWEVLPLGDVISTIDSGWSPLCETRVADHNEWGVLKVSAVSWGEFRPDENKKLPGDLTPRPHLEVAPGDLLVSRANTPELVGRCVLVRWTRPRLMLSDKLLRLRAREDLATPGFIRLALETPSARQQIQDGATGSSRSMKNISQDKLRSVLLPGPSLVEQRSISSAFDYLARRVTVEETCLDALRTLKVALMSVLLTGEVRVKPDEKPA